MEKRAQVEVNSTQAVRLLQSVVMPISKLVPVLSFDINYPSQLRSDEAGFVRACNEETNRKRVHLLLWDFTLA